MGKALPSGVGADGTPPTGQKPFTAAVVSGTITAVGPKAPFCFNGAFNVLIWGELADALTTTAGSDTAVFASATGLAVGQTIKSANLPYGTTIKTKATATVTLGGLSAAQIAAIPAGTDSAATVEHVPSSATVTLERSLDGGQTWVTCNTDLLGTPVTWAFGTLTTPVSLVMREPEQSAAYRLNCTAFTGVSNVTLNYRLSASAQTLAAQPI